jgi:hypothetical protein
MKRFVRILVIISLLVVTLIASASATAAPPTNPFRGFWEGTDIDGSNLHLLLVGGRSSLRVIWLDDYWTICDGDPGLGRGHGTVDSADPNLFHAEITFTCTGALWDTLMMDFVYNPADDTIATGLGTPDEVIWHRWH